MPYDAEQRRNIQALKRTARRYGASPREIKALLEAAAVESNFRHLGYGDRDSVGILQQRPSQGWGPAGESVEQDALQFLSAARKANTGGGSAGKLAQAVQRSAFPGRYDQRSGEVDALLGGSYAAPGGPAADPSLPGGDRQALLRSYLDQRGRPDALLALAQGLRQAEASQSPAAPSPARYGEAPRSMNGKIIGTPYAGTHSLGNWQSDNAVDIAMPVGSQVPATEDAVVVKVRGGYSGGSDRFDGYQVTLRGANGGVFYTHLSKALVRKGQRVRAGEPIGLSGAANGVPHLHYGVERGDPRSRFTGKRPKR